MKKSIIAFLMVSSSVYANTIPVMPMASMNYAVDLQKIVKANIAQEKNQGYISDDDPYIRYMLNIKSKATNEIANNTNAIDTDTHLKGKLSDIKLAFSFSWTHPNAFAFTPVGTYIEGKGWTGVREFFTDPQLGTCNYSFYNLKLSGGHVTLVSETTEYDINGLPGSKYIQGNVNTGFVYSTSWYTPDSMSQIDCANKILDKSYLDKMVVIAKSIQKTN